MHLTISYLPKGKLLMCIRNEKSLRFETKMLFEYDKKFRVWIPKNSCGEKVWTAKVHYSNQEVRLLVLMGILVSVSVFNNKK